MSDKKKNRPWDGRSRVSTQQYKDNYNEIFKKEKTNTKNNRKPHNSVKKPSFGANLQVNAEIVNGTCPHCNYKTVLVSLWTNTVYRCMTCGHDTQQKVNGKISYIPYIVDKNKVEYRLKTNTNG
jgi:DNA-directed RNA polymerase subunit RPC12/RpoP